MKLSDLSYSISYFLSGFIFIISFFLMRSNWQLKNLLLFLASYKSSEVVLGLITIAISVFIGLIFDCIRNCIVERLYDLIPGKPKTINYNFFIDPDKKLAIKEVSNDYYNFYILDLNMAICLLVVIVLNFFMFHIYILQTYAILGIIFILFVADSIILRKDIASITSDSKFPDKRFWLFGRKKHL